VKACRQDRRTQITHPRITTPQKESSFDCISAAGQEMESVPCLVPYFVACEVATTPAHLILLRGRPLYACPRCWHRLRHDPIASSQSFALPLKKQKHHCAMKGATYVWGYGVSHVR